MNEIKIESSIGSIPVSVVPLRNDIERALLSLLNKTSRILNNFFVQYLKEKNYYYHCIFFVLFIAKHFSPVEYHEFGRMPMLSFAQQRWS